MKTVSADGRYITLDHRAIDDDRDDDYGDNDDDRVEGASSMNINCAIHSVIAALQLAPIMTAAVATRRSMSQRAPAKMDSLDPMLVVGDLKSSGC